MKMFNLWKLVPSDDSRFATASWYFKFEFRGKLYKRCLDTPDAAEAQRNARAKYNSIVKAVQLEEYEDLSNALGKTKLRQPKASTLGEMFTVYRRIAGIASVERTVGAVRCILRDVMGEMSEDQLNALSSSVLTGTLLRAYKAKCVDPAAPMDDAKRTAITSCNSTIRQARSLCKKELIGHTYGMSKAKGEDNLYKEEGITLPDLTSFLAVRLFEEPPHHFVPIPEDLMRKIWERLPELKENLPNVYLAFLLCECCGLRRGEAARARVSDIIALPKRAGDNEEVRHVLRLGITKNGRPRLVPLDPRVRDEILALAKVVPMVTSSDMGAASKVEEAVDYILPGSRTHRYLATFESLGNWLKSLGWNRTKKAHELRKHFGSQIAEQFGTRVGAQILGNTEEVFRAHYDALLSMPQVNILKI
jgi:integrase